MTTLFQLNALQNLGSVPNLEKHLPLDWWKSLLASLVQQSDCENTSHTLEDVTWLINTLDLKEEESILDLCCGQGRHSLALCKKHFNRVTGIDRSRNLIRLARRQAKKGNLCVKFSEGDARNLRLGENSHDAVFIFGNTLGSFEQKDEDHQVLAAIKRVLRSSGRVALDLAEGAFVRDQFEPRSWSWIDHSHFVCQERSLSEDKQRLITREVIVHSERGVIIDQFYAEKLYDKELIFTLLKGLDFSSIEIDASAERLLISAIAPTKQATIKKAPKKTEVTVLLGDPHLPDKVKRDGHYNPEDIETVQRLKNALSSLPEFTFKFIDHHKRLISELMTKPPTMVFNLCDEGYMNHATMELHVPSLLEMFKIPYSGAGPDCLAMCYNKSVVRALAYDLDIPVPEETYFGSLDQAASIPSVFPALLKPNFGDNSIGITQKAVVYTTDEFMSYLSTLKEQFTDMPILVQEFLEGKEYSVGIIGNLDNFTILPILEVNFDALPSDLPKILGYESKWDPTSPYWNDISYQEATLEEEEARKLVEYSIRLFERCNCKDYARIDFRADRQGKIKLLEVNPNPGWCWDGKLNKMAAMQGITYAGLLELILTAAKERLSKSVL